MKTKADAPSIQAEIDQEMIEVEDQITDLLSIPPDCKLYGELKALWLRLDVLKDKLQETGI
jgi:hypothetical protein